MTRIPSANLLVPTQPSPHWRVSVGEYPPPHKCTLNFTIGIRPKSSSGLLTTKLVRSHVDLKGPSYPFRTSRNVETEVAFPTKHLTLDSNLISD